ncbi:MAG: hypothetical protein ACRYFR_12820 [Janthinobacterium lividum]
MAGYLQQCKTQGFLAHYTGSLVANFGRNLLKSNIFFTPPPPRPPAASCASCTNATRWYSR